MIKKNLALLVLLIIITAGSVQAAQIPYGDLFDRQQGSGKPVFFSNTVKFFSNEDGKFIMQCFVSLEYDRLHFVKSDTMFTAEYDFGIAVYDDNGSEIPIEQQKERHKLQVSKYTDTESRILKNIHSYKFTLPEGTYSVVLFARDINSKQEYKIEEDVNFKKNKSASGVTEPLVVQLKEQNFSPDSIAPLVSNVIDIKNDEAGIFFEVLSENIGQAYTVSYEIENYRGSTVAKDSFKRIAKDKINYEIIKLKGDSVEIGNYTMNIKVDLDGKTFERNINFLIKWKEFFINFSDLREAVRQMAYIVPADSLNHILKGTDQDVEMYFKTFWNIKSLEIIGSNALMEEYYRRINFANMHFKIPKKQGWRTDMGQVYCVMGEPEEIQSFAFPKNQKPYEIWIYYSKGQQYIFDYIGGEFTLRR